MSCRGVRRVSPAPDRPVSVTGGTSAADGRSRRPAAGGQGQPTGPGLLQWPAAGVGITAAEMAAIIAVIARPAARMPTAVAAGRPRRSRHRRARHKNRAPAAAGARLASARSVRGGSGSTRVDPGRSAPVSSARSTLPSGTPSRHPSWLAGGVSSRPRGCRRRRRRRHRRPADAGMPPPRRARQCRHVNHSRRRTSNHLVTMTAVGPLTRPARRPAEPGDDTYGRWHLLQKESKTLT